uniref:sel1-repeat-containing protein YbeT-like isoform X2 n=2 Tax=Pristiophorus japonicus TaxID=55135 RepID=UPI00398ED27E
MGRHINRPRDSRSTHIDSTSSKLMSDQLIHAKGVTAVLALSFLLYLFLYYQTFHLHVTHAYAHLGYPAAQHSIGQRYLHGLGVEKDEEVAMRWFRKAADQGHPHASYNLAVGKLKAMTSDVEDWEVEELLSRAAVHGLKEAQDALENLHRNSDN